MEAGSLKRARKLSESKPERAIAILERHPLSKGTVGIWNWDNALAMSDMRVELYERVGRHEDAERERAEATRKREELEHPEKALIPLPKKLLERARDQQETDPEAALALLEGLTSERYVEGPELSDLRAEIYEHVGRHEDAERDRVAAVRLREQMLEDLDRDLASAKKPPYWGTILRRAELLEQLGRPVEGTRCRLFAVDMLLAKWGDEGSRAALAGLAWGGLTVPAAVPVLGAARGFGAGLEFAEAFGSAYRAGTGEEKMARGWRAQLVHEGRAIALAQCEQCGGLVEAALPKSSVAFSCLAGHRVPAVRVVATEDAPAGWYSDPWGRFTKRRWAGKAWTSDVMREETPAEDAPGPR